MSAADWWGEMAPRDKAIEGLANHQVARESQQPYLSAHFRSVFLQQMNGVVVQQRKPKRAGDRRVYRVAVDGLKRL